MLKKLMNQLAGGAASGRGTRGGGRRSTSGRRTTSGRGGRGAAGGGTGARIGSMVEKAIRGRR